MGKIVPPDEIRLKHLGYEGRTSKRSRSYYEFSGRFYREIRNPRVQEFLAANEWLQEAYRRVRGLLQQWELDRFDQTGVWPEPKPTSPLGGTREIRDEVRDDRRNAIVRAELLRSRLEEVMGLLDEDDRRLFDLYYVQLLTHEEIGGFIGKNRTTVSRRMKRLRDRVVVLMAGEGYPKDTRTGKAGRPRLHPVPPETFDAAAQSFEAIEEEVNDGGRDRPAA
jgi:RNA polymerase sigma factor (sigma-70 family)